MCDFIIPNTCRLPPLLQQLPKLSFYCRRLSSPIIISAVPVHSAHVSVHRRGYYATSSYNAIVAMHVKQLNIVGRGVHCGGLLVVSDGVECGL